MTQGRPKGSKGEIEVAKILEPWWAAHEPLAPDGNPIRFVRTPLSGGWGGKDTRSGFKASGDLMTTAAKFPFSVEVKRREGWSWRELLAGRRCPVWGWWGQAVEQGKEMKAVPLLWFRKNREDWAVMLPLLVARPLFELRPEGCKLLRAMRVWWPAEIVADYSGQLPILFSSSSFLGVPPAAWLLACEAARQRSA